MRALLSWMLLLSLSACGIDPQISEPSPPPTEPAATTSRYDNSGLDQDVIASYQALEALMAEAAPDNTVAYFALPSETDYANIPADPQNPITEAKITLGKLIFHETGITAGITSMTNTYSCASCHHAKAGFKAGVAQGIGEGGEGFGMAGEGRRVADGLDLLADVQPIASPTVLNTAYQEVMAWNGQFGHQENGLVNAGLPVEQLMPEGTPKAANQFGLSGLETQVIAGAGVHRLDVSDTSLLNTHPTYTALLAEAFPQGYASLSVAAAKAVAAYERSVLANQAPFQRWLQGDNHAMSPQQVAGARVFFGTGQCVSCHTGPALSSPVGAVADDLFMAIGFGDLDWNRDIIGMVPEDVRRGRGGFTGVAMDNYRFKVPTLYNLKDTSILGHGATFSRIDEVVDYKIAGIPQVANDNLDPRFMPLSLTEQERADLIAFLSDSLYDDNLARYTVDTLPSELCPINNDTQSRTELGCEE
ncbi:hypothetical protein NLG07_07905 [Alteromonas sp. LMIT006]|uniref:cytochrome-c peroxidase n=1 Tax=Alteromonadaceae TaxID=72275 RepID=UPI0020CA5052|nr:cytochrome c peroxidase [Alteromonas sp. LMIT006]UTP71934.1 hypothetical protein NLG07_07905 [Alteromonas sp. LMIT006]